MKKALVLLFVLAVFMLPMATSASAASIVQELNIANQEYQTTGVDQPTDNSLGLIEWDASKYSGETVYFEASIKCDSCSGGNARAEVELFNSDGNPVDSTALTHNTSTYTLKRSGDITSSLTTGQKYTARLTLDATAGTAHLQSARLIIIQSANPLTHTRSAFEIGSADTTANTNYELVGSVKIASFDPALFAPSASVTFEASLKGALPSSIMYAALSTSATCATTISGSEVSVTGPNWNLGQSSSLSLSNNLYWVCIKTSDGNTGAIANARILADQSGTLGIAKNRSRITMANHLVSDNDNVFTNVGFPISFDRSQYASGMLAAYYEATLYSSADITSTRLYDLTNTAEVLSSEITTTNNNSTYKRSEDIWANLPATTGDLTVELKNSSTSTSYLSHSALLVDYQAYPSITFAIEGVASTTTTNGVTTTNGTTATALTFGNLGFSTPGYIAHRLGVTSNAANGYTVTVKMLTTLQGEYPANVIDDFPSSWVSPTAWSSPDGTTPNINTAYFGANTSDARVPGWETGSGKFAGLGTISNIVMQSSGVDSGTNIYVTYAMEVNERQPTDSYAATLQYNLLPTY